VLPINQVGVEYYPGGCDFFRGRKTLKTCVTRSGRGMPVSGLIRIRFWYAASLLALEELQWMTQVGQSQSFRILQTIAIW